MDINEKGVKEMTSATFWRYENKLLIILALGWGFLFLDRLAINYLMPFIIVDIDLTNTQIGFIAAAFSVTWAISSFFGGMLGDLLGKRKALLILFILLFSLSSFLTGLASTFVVLLFIRMFMGLVEGPYFPIGATLMSMASSEKRRGFNIGFLQNFSSNFLGGTLGPIILVALATAIGWRYTFFLTLLPGLIVAFLVWRYVKDPEISPEATSLSASGQTQKESETVRIADVFKYRNMWLCFLIGIFFIPWYILLFTFSPLYLTEIKQVSPEVMSYVMAAIGIGSAVWGFIVPAISDRWGRKPTFILFALISMLAPLSIVFFNGPYWLLWLIVFIGSAGPGCMALYMSIIPSETIPPKLTGTAIGLAVGIGETIGGFGIVSLAGALGDVYGLSAPLLISGVSALIAPVIALFFIETAPIKVKAKQDVSVSHI
jgi:MFS family permease